jgi:hypothetical protein
MSKEAPPDALREADPAAPQVADYKPIADYGVIGDMGSVAKIGVE